MIRKGILIFGLNFLMIILFIQSGIAQPDSLKWFPGEGLKPLLEYDLMETRPYFGIFGIKSDSSISDGAYIPVNIGFRKPVLQFKVRKAKINLLIGAAAYTQFNIERYDANILRGGLLNIDYKVNGILSLVQGRHNFRLHLFHVSSHLGDDYILRNQHFELNDKSVNYEQIELLYMYSVKNMDAYLVVGEVVGRNTFRKRFMVQTGVQARKPLLPKLSLAYGCDIKIYEENDFQPDIHLGLGLAIGQENDYNMKFTIDGYYGSLPYSTLDWGKVKWLGVSTSLYL